MQDHVMSVYDIVLNVKYLSGAVSLLAYYMYECMRVVFRGF